MNEPQHKPITETFIRLAYVFQALHMWNKPDVDNLHDIWQRGAPTPNSIIRNPIHYDPRLPQKGNYEARIVFPNMLLAWARELARKRGVKATDEQLLGMLDTVGAIFSGDVKERVIKGR